MQLRHEVLGLDIDEFPLFGEFVAVFGVPRMIWTIEAFKPLPALGPRFDCITAFAVSFNRSAARDWYWGPNEWNFFLNDLEQYLAPGGQIFFSLNRSRQEGDYYTPELREFFIARGATVERDRIFFAHGLQPAMARPLRPPMVGLNETCANNDGADTIAGRLRKAEPRAPKAFGA